MVKKCGVMCVYNANFAEYQDIFFPLRKKGYAVSRASSRDTIAKKLRKIDVAVINVGGESSVLNDERRTRGENNIVYISRQKPEAGIVALITEPDYPLEKLEQLSDVEILKMPITTQDLVDAVERARK